MQWGIGERGVGQRTALEGRAEASPTGHFWGWGEGSICLLLLLVQGLLLLFGAWLLLIGPVLLPLSLGRLLFLGLEEGRGLRAGGSNRHNDAMMHGGLKSPAQQYCVIS